MKISIDTTADSKEDIRKAIKLLMSLVEGHVYSNEIDVRDMFSNPSATTQTSDMPASQPTNILSIFDNPQAIAKTEEKKDIPDIEFY